MKTDASTTDLKTGETRRVTAGDVYKKGSRPLEVQTIALDDLESLTMGFRQSMFEFHDDEGTLMGGMFSGAGCGNDHILMEWDGKKVLVRGSEMFKAWVATFDPEAAKQFAS